MKFSEKGSLEEDPDVDEEETPVMGRHCWSDSHLVCSLVIEFPCFFSCEIRYYVSYLVVVLRVTLGVGYLPFGDSGLTSTYRSSITYIQSNLSHNECYVEYVIHSLLILSLSTENN